MRPLLMGGLWLAIAGAAPLQGLQAQAIYTDPGRLSALQMQIDQAQRDALASQQAADAAQMRLETEQRVASLNARGIDRTAALAPPQSAAAESAILQSAIDRARELDDQVGADADRMSQLTAQALARGNARIVAVKPALR